LLVLKPAAFALDHGGPVDRPYEPFPDAALDGSIPDRFEAIARRHADRPAVADATASLSYRELLGQVERIGAAVAAAGEGRPGPVALLMRNGVAFPAALLGVMAAGRCVVPLDAEHPLERNRRIADHAGAALVVSAGELSASARRLFTGRMPVLDIGSLEAGTARPAVSRPGPKDLAYILYTSGSTGAPKGVCHTHRNGLHDTLTFTNSAHVTPEDRMVVFYSGVIGAVRRTFSALLNGACLHLLSPAALGAKGLADEIRARGITILYEIPTIFRRVAAAIEPGQRFESIRMVRLSGDRSEWSDYDLFRRAFPQGAFFGVNLGSTEVSSTIAHWCVDEAFRVPGGRLPVGRVMQGLSVQVVGDTGEPLGPGEVGEFVVTGRHIALGYWREEALTAERFSISPADPEERRFRTGDLGLLRPDGLLEFVGRKDQLIKLKGHRVEPAEVEGALRGCSGVADGAVVIRRSPDGRALSMIAYVELAPGVQGLLPRHVIAMLSRVLPRHMLPAMLHIVDSLPRLATFKVDRAALAALDAARDKDDVVRRRDPLLDEVALAFEAVLGVKGATPEDNLLSLGGDSLQAVDVMLEIQRRTGVEIPEEVFAESRTIGELTRWIVSPRPAAETSRDHVRPA
jgi:amino acid adenylation domain-containing protein